MNTSVITLARRVNLAKITSGAVSTIPKITHIAFGDGGCDVSGEPIIPLETNAALMHEVARYPIDDVAYPVDTTAQYTATIPEIDHAGINFNEMALVDEYGVLCAIKTMYPKKKDGDVKFTFTFDDEF